MRATCPQTDKCFISPWYVLQVKPWHAIVSGFFVVSVELVSDCLNQYVVVLQRVLYYMQSIEITERNYAIVDTNR